MQYPKLLEAYNRLRAVAWDRPPVDQLPPLKEITESSERFDGPFDLDRAEEFLKALSPETFKAFVDGEDEIRGEISARLGGEMVDTVLENLMYLAEDPNDDF